MMMGALLIATLSLSAAVSGSAVNVPCSHSLVRGTSGFSSHLTLLLEKRDSFITRDLVCNQSAVARSVEICSTGGCCNGSCCGLGCCPDDYVCVSVDNMAGCCPVGQTCSDQFGGCLDPTLVKCPDPYPFCCPVGQVCNLDANGNSHCGSLTGDGNGNATTNTNTTVTPGAVVSQSTQMNTSIGATTTTTTSAGTGLSSSHSITTLSSSVPTSISSSGSHSGAEVHAVVRNGILWMVALVAGALIQ